jgi:hypothetical protein
VYNCTIHGTVLFKLLCFSSFRQQHNDKKFEAVRSTCTEVVFSTVLLEGATVLVLQ